MFHRTAGFLATRYRPNRAMHRSGPRRATRRAYGPPPGYGDAASLWPAARLWAASGYGCHPLRPLPGYGMPPAYGPPRATDGRPNYGWLHFGAPSEGDSEPCCWNAGFIFATLIVAGVFMAIFDPNSSSSGRSVVACGHGDCAGLVFFRDFLPPGQLVRIRLHSRPAGTRAPGSAPLRRPVPRLWRGDHSLQSSSVSKRSSSRSGSSLAPWQPTIP